MKNILLGVTGSVAAIKVLELTTALAVFANIKIITTQQGEYFLQAQLDGLNKINVPVLRDHDEWPILKEAYNIGEPILHIELRRWADLMLIAPLDANTLAKITHGLCDNLLTSTFRAWDWAKPIVICPAMNTMMWNNAPTLEQVSMLRQWGASIIHPIEKKLACNDIGMGAMEVVQNIVKFVNEVLQSKNA